MIKAIPYSKKVWWAESLVNLLVLSIWQKSLANEYTDSAKGYNCK